VTIHHSVSVCIAALVKEPMQNENTVIPPLAPIASR